MIKSITAAVIAGAFLVPLAHADSGHQKKAASEASQPAPMADGEIRRIDKDAKKITIKHGPLESLDMPAMTMVFQVRDLAMLERVKVGDKVKFQAEKIGGGFAVVKIEPAD